jgi:hypothetical protein
MSLAAWREKYGCKVGNCQNAGVALSGRCKKHLVEVGESPASAARFVPEADVRFIEQPPCANCGHRRIHHFAMKCAGGNGRNKAEIAAHCMVDTDNPKRIPCGCATYEPQELAHAG